MKAPFDVVERLAQLHQHMPAVRLYALLDGAQYLIHVGASLQPRPGFYPLFAGTNDSPLAHAGPWLIDAELAGQLFVEQLAALEQKTPAVTWLIALQDLSGLAQLLQLKLDTVLPDGRTALLRFWDPRVLVDIVKILEPDQLAAFFAHIHEWHLLHEGKRVWIERQHAATQ